MKRLIFLCLVAVNVIFFPGCNDDEHSDNTAEKIWAIATTHPNCFTVNITDMSFPQEGIVVSYAATQNSFGKENLGKVIEHAHKHDHIVGGWKDSTVYYFDSNRIFQEDSLEAAITFGREQRQKAIYILSLDSIVYLE